MLTQAGRLLGIFKTCASVPAGEPWGVEGTLVLWACPLGTVRNWQREEASLARLPSLRAAHHSGTHTTLPLTGRGPRNLGNFWAVAGTA